MTLEEYLINNRLTLEVHEASPNSFYAIVSDEELQIAGNEKTTKEEAVEDALRVYKESYEFLNKYRTDEEIDDMFYGIIRRGLDTFRTVTTGTTVYNGGVVIDDFIGEDDNG